MVERRVLVHRQELSLHVEDPQCAVLAGHLGLELVVGAIEVVQVVGRDRAEHPHELRRYTGLVRQRVRLRPREQLGEAVHPVDLDGADPREMVEPRVTQPHPLGLDPEDGGEPALEADGHVAQPDGPMPLVEQGSRHDARPGW